MCLGWLFIIATSRRNHFVYLQVRKNSRRPTIRRRSHQFATKNFCPKLLLVQWKAPTVMTEFARHEIIGYPSFESCHNRLGSHWGSSLSRSSENPAGLLQSRSELISGKSSLMLFLEEGTKITGSKVKSLVGWRLANYFHFKAEGARFN